MGLTQTAEGLLELLPHFKGFSDREAALFSTVSSFTHACVCVCVFLVHVCLSTGNENSCVVVP